MRKEYLVFIDFDGTITSRDVGYEMFKRFTEGRTQPIVDKYRRGEVNSYTCLKTECEIWNRFPPDDGDVLDFLKNQDISEGFKEFIEILNGEKIRQYVVSEGFDFYIDAILNANGLSNLDRITNRAIYKDHKIIPDFPFYGKGCGECSSCKGYHIKRLTEPKTCVVFLGDGHSDIHGAREADIVFARSFLKEALEKIGRNYFEYENFYDIIDSWRQITSRKIFSISERLFLCSSSAERRGDFERLWGMGEVMRHVGYPEGLGWSRRQLDDYWESLDQKEFILFAIEDKSGNFIGEAKLSFPDKDGLCSHDVKLLPEFQGRGYGREAWSLLVELSRRRWPDSKLAVTPSTDNVNAIKMYESLGFEFDGEQQEWIPSVKQARAVPVSYIRMIKP